MSTADDASTMLFRATIDDELIVESAVICSEVPSILADIAAFIAQAGISRDDARLWAMNALETRCYAEGSDMLDRVVGTLLWLACRGHPGGERIEEAIRQGGILACRFRRREQQPGKLTGLQFVVLPRTAEQKVTAPQSKGVH
jgi:hypothetical protein